MTPERELLKRAGEILSREFGECFPEEKPEVSEWFAQYDAFLAQPESACACDQVEQNNAAGQVDRKDASGAERESVRCRDHLAHDGCGR